MAEFQEQDKHIQTGRSLLSWRYKHLKWQLQWLRISFRCKSNRPRGRTKEPQQGDSFEDGTLAVEAAFALIGKVHLDPYFKINRCLLRIRLELWDKSRRQFTLPLSLTALDAVRTGLIGLGKHDPNH